MEVEKRAKEADQARDLGKDHAGLIHLNQTRPDLSDERIRWQAYCLVYASQNQVL
jgi:hypothetical protein